MPTRPETSPRNQTWRIRAADAATAMSKIDALVDNHGLYLSPRIRHRIRD